MIPHFPFVGSRLLPDDNAEVGVVFSLGKLVSCPAMEPPPTSIPIVPEVEVDRSAMGFQPESKWPEKHSGLVNGQIALMIIVGDALE
jgi:hypothetical protein